MEKINEKNYLTLDELKEKLGEVTKWQSFWWAVERKITDISYWLWPLNWFKHSKWFFQRAKRGYSDDDLFDMFATMSQRIPCMLRDLISQSTIVDWQGLDKKILEIAEAFEEYYKIENGDINFKTPEGDFDFEAEGKRRIELQEKMKDLFDVWPALWW